MPLHRASGNRRLGLALASITTLVWGVLPLMLQILLETMNSPSIVWYRFLIATACLGGVLAWRRALPRSCRASEFGCSEVQRCDPRLWSAKPKTLLFSQNN